MRGLVLIVLALSAVRCVAAPAVTNSVSGVVSVTVATNAPAAKSSIAKAAEGKLPRQQCEAITKSGNRCKRNAVSGERLCLQHRKILSGTDRGECIERSHR